MEKVTETESGTPKPHIPETIELVICDSCGARDWKIYSHEEPYMSQDGDGCLHCDDGVLRKHKRFYRVGDQE